MATGNKRKASNELALFPVNFPAGTIIPFAGATAPEGWALCDGSTVSRTTYVALYSALGDAWGNGDGSTTFHLPDLRGRFLRGVDGGAGRDLDSGSRTPSNTGGNSADAVGSVQDDAIRNINGTFRVSAFQGGNSMIGRSGAFTNQSNFNSSFAGGGGGVNTGTTYNFSASNQVPTGSDNRPINAAVNYIIKL